MKKLKLAIVALYLLPFMAMSQIESDAFKVLTYNIWNGYDWGKDEERRGDVQKWIGSETPDVVALQELCAYTPEKLREDAASWGHEYSVLLKTTGYSVGLTSKYPIDLKERIMEGMHHGALHCSTNGIDFLVIHLHPHSIERRRQEAEIISKKLDAIAKSNPKFIVLGDFNAHSPFDMDLYDREGHLLNRMRESNADKGLAGNIDGGQFDYAVMSKFLSYPLYDVVSNRTKGLGERGSFPGRVLAGMDDQTIDQLILSLERIDYILVSPSLFVKGMGAKVHNGPENWFLSDHYPVSFSFSLQE